jgi:TolA-binding protein
MTKTITNANAATTILFLGHNGEWWDSWLIVSVIVAALAAIAVCVTTAGSIISHTREATTAEEALERYKLETGKQLAEATARQKEADQRIVESRERTAGLEVEAARLRLELDREIQKRAQRILTDEQRSAIREGLAGMKEIAIVAQHDLEAEAFSLQIMTSLPDGLRVHAPKPPGEDK